MNKIINSSCPICKTRINNNDVVMCHPCQHMMHIKCMKYINMKCRACGQRINNIYTIDSLRKVIQKTNNNSYKQMYNDMIALNTSYSYEYTPKFILTPAKPLFMANYLLRAQNAKNIHDIDVIGKNILNTLNIKTNIIGKEKLVNNQKCVIISNHTSYLDPLVIYNALKCGFIASDVVNDYWYLRNVFKIMPALIIKRGKYNNTVQKMKEFIRKRCNLCIFPEGVLTHPDTLIRFRTGAFRTGYPVQPIIIKYKPKMMHNDAMMYLSNLINQDKIDVTIKVLDMEYPPFDKKKIESIRRKMAAAGNLALSRVSNRDIID